jgi:hypothetical protein
VLKGYDEMPSLAASLSLAADLIKGHIDDTAANGVRWGDRLALIAALSHFPELETKLELLGSGRNANLTEGQLDALWIQMHRASESLALSIPPSVARDSPDDTGEE